MPAGSPGGTRGLLNGCVISTTWASTFRSVMPPPPQCYYTVPLDIAVKATRIVNEGIAEYVARQPDRFVGLGSVPMTDGHEAAVELERSMRTLGLQGRPGAHQCRRSRTVSAAIRAFLEKGRGAWGARCHSSEWIHRRPASHPLLFQ